jgi:hypothetical protein
VTLFSKFGIFAKNAIGTFKAKSRKVGQSCCVQREVRSYSQKISSQGLSWQVSMC